MEQRRHRLAPLVIVDTKTPGRLLSGRAFKVGHLDTFLASYLTWKGRMLENNGIVPKFLVELSRDGLREGRDTRLDTIEIATGFDDRLLKSVNS